MNEKLIAQMFRAAAKGQLAPFHRNGASWSGNAYEVAASASASFDMMAEVFEKASIASEPPTVTCGFCKQLCQREWTYCPACGAQERIANG